MSNFSKKALSVFVAVGLFLFVFAGRVYASMSVNALIDQTNKVRVNNGLSALRVSEKLNAAAYAKAMDMLEKDYWSHTSPKGKTPWDFISEAGYAYEAAGENLAKGFKNDGDVINGWLNSQYHRDNIMSDDYTEIGIAVVSGDFNGKNTTIVVQMFGRPSARRVGFLGLFEFFNRL